MATRKGGNVGGRERISMKNTTISSNANTKKTTPTLLHRSTTNTSSSSSINNPQYKQTSSSPKPNSSSSKLSFSNKSASNTTTKTTSLRVRQPLSTATSSSPSASSSNSTRLQKLSLTQRPTTTDKLASRPTKRSSSTLLNRSTKSAIPAIERSFSTKSSPSSLSSSSNNNLKKLAKNKSSKSFELDSRERDPLFQMMGMGFGTGSDVDSQHGTEVESLHDIDELPGDEFLYLGDPFDHLQTAIYVDQFDLEKEASIDCAKDKSNGGEIESKLMEEEEEEEASLNRVGKTRKAQEEWKKEGSEEVYNEVIERAASKLLGNKNNKNKVSALAGAFESVISLQGTK